MSHYKIITLLECGINQQTDELFSVSGLLLLKRLLIILEQYKHRYCIHEDTYLKFDDDEVMFQHEVIQVENTKSHLQLQYIYMYDEDEMTVMLDDGTDDELVIIKEHLTELELQILEFDEQHYETE